MCQTNSLKEVSIKNHKIPELVDDPFKTNSKGTCFQRTTCIKRTLGSVPTEFVLNFRTTKLDSCFISISLHDNQVILELPFRGAVSLICSVTLNGQKTYLNQRNR